MDIKNIQHIHFIGLGGIGVSALAKFFLSRGVVVSGSDVQSSEMLETLEKRGVQIFIGHTSENMTGAIDLVVYSDAVPRSNPEREKAREEGIPSLSYAKMLGELMRKYYGIAVSGTNGKTTTTAMLGKIFEESKKDALVVVGGKVPGWDGNLYLPSKEKREKESKQQKQNEPIFIAEACEYRRNMLHLNPSEILLTNIELDHLDYYRDLEDLLDAFEEYVLKLPEAGVLFYNADDSHCRAIAQRASCRTVSYGIHHEADVRALHIRKEQSDGRGEGGRQLFEVYFQGKSVGTFAMPLPGEFNISNALGAIAVALSHHIPAEGIRKTLADFHGTWRRFERLGEYKGKTLISDYAHHPTAVGKTIEGAKNLFGSKKILVAFQPHQKDRTEKLFDDFVKSFDCADGVILAEIYDVTGRSSKSEISARELVRPIEERSGKTVHYAKDLETVKASVDAQINDYDVVLFMGAGDIYKVVEDLSKWQESQKPYLTFEHEAVG